MVEEGDVSPGAASSQAEERLLPARMLNELVYCQRLFWLEHVAGEWEDNSDTVAGKSVHRRVDRKVDGFPLAEQLAPDLVRAAPWRSRSWTRAPSVTLEYKRGRSPAPGHSAGDRTSRHTRQCPSASLFRMCLARCSLISLWRGTACAIFV